LDFICEFHPNSSNGYKWIITAMDYFTRSVEAIPTKKATNKVIIDFIKEKIITRFGVPAKITTNNAQAFRYMEMVSVFIIALYSHSSNHYP